MGKDANVAAQIALGLATGAFSGFKKAKKEKKEEAREDKKFELLQRKFLIEEMTAEHNLETSKLDLDRKRQMNELISPEEEAQFRRRQMAAEDAKARREEFDADPDRMLQKFTAEMDKDRTHIGYMKELTSAAGRSNRGGGGGGGSGGGASFDPRKSPQYIAATEGLKQIDGSLRHIQDLIGDADPGSSEYQELVDERNALLGQRQQISSGLMQAFGFQGPEAGKETASPEAAPAAPSAQAPDPNARPGIVGSMFDSLFGKREDPLAYTRSYEETDPAKLKDAQTIEMAPAPTAKPPAPFAGMSGVTLNPAATAAVKARAQNRGPVQPPLQEMQVYGSPPVNQASILEMLKKAFGGNPSAY